MLPAFYPKVLRTHLSKSHYLTLQLLVILLQSHRQIQLSRLAGLFPQPIHYSSRIRILPTTKSLIFHIRLQLPTEEALNLIAKVKLSLVRSIE